MQSHVEVADVFRRVGSKIESYGLNTWQLRTLYAIKKCRTAELGGHIDACDECGTPLPHESFRVVCIANPIARICNPCLTGDVSKLVITINKLLH